MAVISSASTWSPCKVDVLFIYSDKYISKMKRMNWLAIQSQVKGHKPNIFEEKEKMRFYRKLKRHREKYGWVVVVQLIGYFFQILSND